MGTRLLSAPLALALYVAAALVAVNALAGGPLWATPDPGWALLGAGLLALIGAANR